MVLAAVGVLASIFGSLLVKTGESTNQSTLLKALRRGTNTSAIIIAVVSFPLVWFILGSHYIGFYFAILAGLLAGVLIDSLPSTLHLTHTDRPRSWRQIRDRLRDDHHRRPQPRYAVNGGSDHHHCDLRYGGICTVRRIH